MEFAVSKQFGYLSVNPVLSGVALSATCVLRLPALCQASSPDLAEVCRHLCLTPSVLASPKGSVEICSAEFWASEAKLVQTLCRGIPRLLLADELSRPEAQAAHQESALERDIKQAWKGEQMWGPMTEILDWLFLGSRFNAANERRLMDKNIAQIINVAKDCPNWFAGGTSRYQPAYYNVAIEDTASEQLLPHIEAVIDLMESCRKAGRNVLIHCNCGVSRSAAFVVAYLLKYDYCNKDSSVVAAPENPTVRDTLDWVRAKRNVVCPNQGFMEQLMKYNNESAYGVAQTRKRCIIS